MFAFIIRSSLFLAGCEKADVLALFCVMFLCVFVTFPCLVNESGMVLDCIDS